MFGLPKHEDKKEIKIVVIGEHYEFKKDYYNFKAGEVYRALYMGHLVLQGKGAFRSLQAEKMNELIEKGHVEHVEVAR